MYKIVFMDMDGTLLKSDGSISDYTYETMKTLKNNGIKLILCTGRMHQNARHFAKLMELETPLISSNGAVIKEIHGENYIYRKALGVSNLKYIQKSLNESDLRANYYTTDTLYVGIMRKYVKTYERLNEILDEEDKIKIHYFIEDTEEDIENAEVLKNAENVYKAMLFPKEESNSLVAEKLSKNPYLNVVSSGLDNIEVTHNESDKFYAVKYLCDYYKIDIKDAICFGDSLNDLKMLSSDALTVAMKNAGSLIKSSSKDITLSNDEDGVAYYLRKIFKDLFE